MLPADLPPAPPYVTYSSVAIPLAPCRLANEPTAQAKNTAKPKISKEQANFSKAVKTFQEGLSKLPSNHKAELLKFHGQIEAWVDGERAAGKKADKLASFVGKVMTYLHQRLLVIETEDPKLEKMKAEHRQLQKLFLQGDDVINAYLAWVKNKKDPVVDPDEVEKSPSK